MFSRETVSACGGRKPPLSAGVPHPCSKAVSCWPLPYPRPQATGGCRAPDRNLGESAEAYPSFSGGGGCGRGVFHGNAAAAGRFACIYDLLSSYDWVFRTPTVRPCPDLRAWAPQRERPALRSLRMSALGWSRERPGRGRDVRPASSLRWKRPWAGP